MKKNLHSLEEFYHFHFNVKFRGVNFVLYVNMFVAHNSMAKCTFHIYIFPRILIKGWGRFCLEKEFCV